MISVGIGLSLFALVVLVLVRMGCREIVSLCAALERDRAVQYSRPVPPIPARPAPQWVLVASGKAVRRV